MKKGKRVSEQAHQNAQRGASGKLGSAIRIDHAHTLHIVAPSFIVRRLNHSRRQVKVRQRAVLVCQTQSVATLYVN